MNKSTAVIGSILIFFGLIFLLRSLDLIWIDFGDILRVLFPLALISAGIWLIGRHKKGGIIKASIHLSETPSATGPEKPQTANIDPAHLAQQQAEHSVAPNAPPRPTFEQTSHEFSSGHAGGKLRFNKMLGDMFIDCEGYNLTNVEVSAGVGDVEIKVSGGILSKGLNRMIVSGFIGDVRIFVPKGFAFFSHCSNFVGDIDVSGNRASGFGNTIEHQSPGYEQADSKLYIAASNFIGDIKVYQV